MTSLRYLLNCRSFISLMVLFSFFDNFGMEEEEEDGETEENKYDYLFKVVFVGDAAVGKTQIIKKFVNNSFSDEYLTTMGLDFYEKIINSNEKKIKLVLWDSAGQEKFRVMMQNYYENAHLIVFVYAVDDKNTFKNIKNWVKNVKEQTNEKPKFLLVGNKCDLEDKRQVSIVEAQQYAKTNNMEFIEVSAKKGKNIENMFNSIIKDFLDDMEKNFTHNNHQYIKPNFSYYFIQNKDGIKTSFCDKYCSCCPCLKKTKKNNEEQEELKGEEQEEKEGEEQEEKEGEEQEEVEEEEEI